MRFYWCFFIYPRVFYFSLRFLFFLVFLIFPGVFFLAFLISTCWYQKHEDKHEEKRKKNTRKLVQLSLNILEDVFHIKTIGSG